MCLSSLHYITDFLNRKLRGPRADITCLRSSRDYVPVSRSSILAVFRTMSSLGISPETNMFAFVSYAFGAFLVSSQNEFLPLNPGIFNIFFVRKLKIICFDDLERIPKQEQIRCIGQNLDWCREHMYYCSEFVILCALT